jgi:hypothetical protein
MQVVRVTKGNVNLDNNNNARVTSFINLDKLPVLISESIALIFRLLPLVIPSKLGNVDEIGASIHTIFTLAAAWTILRTL